MSSLIFWDTRIFFLLNGLAGRSVWFDAVVVFFGEWTAFLLPFVLTGCWFRIQKFVDIRSYLLNLSTAAALARFGVVELVRLFVVRIRPYINQPDVVQLIHKFNEPAFPSGHTAAIMALGIVLFQVHQTAGFAVCFLAILVGLSRVIAGVHYPSDVLGGILAGCLSGYLIVKLFKF